MAKGDHFSAPGRICIRGTHENQYVEKITTFQKKYNIATIEDAAEILIAAGLDFFANAEYDRDPSAVVPYATLKED